MKKTEDIQIETLVRWVKVKLAPSDIHGVGVFAITDIPSGTKLYLDIMPEMFYLPAKKITNNLPEHVSELILERWPLVLNGSAFIYPDCRFVAYMNHSDDANFDAKECVTLRDVKKGEEITEDYRQIDDYKTVYPWLN